MYGVFFFKDTAAAEIYTLSLRGALPVSLRSLERIIIEGEQMEREKKELQLAAADSLPKIHMKRLQPAMSPKFDLTERSPLQPAEIKTIKSTNVSTNHKKIAEILQIEPDSINAFDTTTINELLRFKTEQEITKQEQLKNDFAYCTLDLLRLAQSLKVSPDLIPLLLGSDIKIEELRQKIKDLSSYPSGLKRQADLVLSGPTKKAASVTDQEKPRTVSPGRSPYQLPKLPILHTRNNSGNNVEREPSPSMSNAKPVLLPLPITGKGLSPSYPVYFHPSPPGSETKFLGSPYNQKQNIGVVSTASLPPTANSVPNLGAPNTYTLPAAGASNPYQYYMGGTPPENMMVQPPPLHYRPLPVPAPNALDERINKIPGGGNILRFDKQGSEDHASSKKAKASKSSSINFMISTPENPPAKKYNKNN